MAKSKDAAVPSEPMSDKERQLKWQTEDDLRAFTRAEEVRGDPKRVKRVVELAKTQSAETDSVVASLAKRGLISDKAKAKMKGKGK